MLGALTLEAGNRLVESRYDSPGSPCRSCTMDARYYNIALPALCVTEKARTENSKTEKMGEHKYRDLWDPALSILRGASDSF
jgi:hypothetical protein